MPRTGAGKWSVRMGGLFFLFFGVFLLLAISGQQGGDTFQDNLVLAIPGLIADLFGVLAFLLGIYSIIWRKERSFLVLLVTSVGSMFLLLLLGEVLFPH